MHTIDLDNKLSRMDLIKDIDYDFLVKKEKFKDIIIERVEIDSKISRMVNKKKGNYISISFNDITDSNNREKVIDVLTNELKNLLISKELIGKSSLVVGLGNIMSTPDSLGPKVIDNIIATRHLFEVSEVDNNFSKVAKIAPGVFSTTGIETFDIIKGIVKSIKPDFLIVIDALSSTSINHINKLIQITDSAIEPGSGVGNIRKEISKNNLGTDVIVIGVPTVVNLHTIVKDFLDEYDIDDVLNKKGNNFLVTPKEIDFTIDKFSKIIAKSINNTLHNMTK